MARARNIKPGFFKNELLAEMSAETRLLFIGMWTLADREGRLEDRPKRIKGELFAYESFDVESMLNRLQQDEFLVRYEVDGVRYIQILNFVKHQDPHYKERKSEIPAIPGEQNKVLATGISREQRRRILERDGYKCRECSATEYLCLDHVIPVSRGGDSSDENMQVLCLSCNTKKGNKLDGEDRNYRRSRLDVDPTLPRTKRPQPSDSLIPDSLIPDSLIPESLKKAKPRSAFAPPAWIEVSAWQGFEQMRVKARKPMTDTARGLIVKELDSLKAKGFDPVAVLEQSVRNNWQDVYPLKDKGGNSTQSLSSFMDERDKRAAN